MQCFFRLLLAGVFAFAVLTADRTKAVTVSIDYSFDSANFFGAGNPDGAAAGIQARASLEAVAGFYSTLLTDTLSTIQTPADFHSSDFDGVVTWQWQASFTNPGTGASTTLFDETIASDEYRIYVGARSLAGSTLGVGGPGGWGWSSNPSGGFTQGEINQINAISDAFSDAVSTRGEATGFANWGGVISFDNDAGTNWHFDHLTSPSAGESDFFSTAIHEFGHSLGLGTAAEWNSLVSGTSFFGTAAVSEHGGPVPLDCSGTCSGHWAEGTTSVVLGTAVSQEAAMDPTLTSGGRKRLTDLDAAALTDIGWTVVAPTFSPGDFDQDGDVDAIDLATFSTGFGVNSSGDADGDGDTDGGDFLLWQQNYTGPLSPAIASVPEPSTLLLGALASVGMLIQRRRPS